MNKKLILSALLLASIGKPSQAVKYCIEIPDEIESELINTIATSQGWVEGSEITADVVVKKHVAENLIWTYKRAKMNSIIHPKVTNLEEAFNNLEVE
jgi:hypothetical protein